MILRFSSKYTKRYRKLPDSLQEKVDNVIREFYKNPFAPSLQNHKLKGKMSYARAILVGYDFRIVFQEFDNYTLVLMLDLGTHNQVY